MVKAKSHLLKHEVPDNVDTAGHFGTDDKKEIARRVAAMGQRQLQVNIYKRHVPFREFDALRRAVKGGRSVGVTFSSALRRSRSAGVTACLRLQDMFRLVYNAATGSNNNNWLRRKLLEGKEPERSALPELPATA